MVKKIGSFRRKTRHKLSKERKTKGKISFTSYFQKFEAGEKVLLKAEPAMHKGMYYPNYHGKIGIVKGRRGGCYEVVIKDHSKEKVLIIHPVHLRRM